MQIIGNTENKPLETQRLCVKFSGSGSPHPLLVTLNNLLAIKGGNLYVYFTQTKQ